MAKSATVIALRSRPLRTAVLSFETSGILASNTDNEQDSIAQLGQPVFAFDFDAYYDQMRLHGPATSDPSLLIYDPAKIRLDVSKQLLASLRAQPVNAALLKAIKQRQNAYYAKYGHISAIVDKMTEFYDPSSEGSKLALLEVLSKLADLQAEVLREAYFADGRTSVVRSTTSTLSSKAHTEETGSTARESADRIIPTQRLEPLPVGGDGGNVPVSEGGGGGVFEPGFFGDGGMHVELGQDTTGSSSITSEDQTLTATDYAYRVPAIENSAQQFRAQISLIDERAEQFFQTLHFGQLTAFLNNEGQSLDLDVYQLQLAYLGTLLLSPISGVVTGVYKQPGDAVRAGEPVVRVEDNSTVLLAGCVAFQGRINIGMPFTVHTSLFGQSNSPVEFTGTVVSARGDHADSRWEVVVQSDNTGSTPLPLNYHFDYDDTTVTVG